jgi:hypothetical protein
MITNIILPVLCVFVAWKGLATARPAADGAEHDPEIRVRASAWTHACCAAFVLTSALLGRHVVIEGGRSSTFGLPIAVSFAAIAAWMWWDLSQIFVIGADGIRICRPGFPDRRVSFKEITKLDVGPPYFVVTARFADGTRITFLPCLFDADEGARRVLVSSPLAVVDAVGGRGGEAVRRLRERNAQARTDR